MSDEIEFDRSATTPPGEVARLSPLVRRVIAGNGGPMTFTGTCSYIVGRGTVAIIDPGPDDAAHVARLLEAVSGETVSEIVVTHTHRDHSPAARALAQATGAPIHGEGPHRPARALELGEINPLDASGDHDFRPDVVLGDGDRVVGDGWTLEVIATPGHTTNHLCFALAEEDTIFSGDHVMAWSTSIVAPPDGLMADYMASLARLAARPERLLLPAHGAGIADPAEFLDALSRHRRGREASVLDRLAAGDETIPDMVRVIYADVDRSLHGAAALSVLAHIEDLVGRGLVVTDGRVDLAARYRLV